MCVASGTVHWPARSTRFLSASELQSVLILGKILMRTGSAWVASSAAKMGARRSGGTVSGPRRCPRATTAERSPPNRSRVQSAWKGRAAEPGACRGPARRAIDSTVTSKSRMNASRAVVSTQTCVVTPGNCHARDPMHPQDGFKGRVQEAAVAMLRDDEILLFRGDTVPVGPPSARPADDKRIARAAPDRAGRVGCIPVFGADPDYFHATTGVPLQPRASAPESSRRSWTCHTGRRLPWRSRRWGRRNRSADLRPAVQRSSPEWGQFGHSYDFSRQKRSQTHSIYHSNPIVPAVAVAALRSR